MALREVLPALQQGTIDGVNAVMTVFTAFRYYDWHEYSRNAALVADFNMPSSARPSSTSCPRPAKNCARHGR
jgi:hypothetical protein